MKKLLICILLLSLIPCTGFAKGKKDLVFGAIAVGKVSKTRNSLQPLLDHLQKTTGYTFTFKTGKDYSDTIKKFQNGEFDLGFIGPSPYIIATTDSGKDSLDILAGLETNHQPYFYATIIAKKDNGAISSLDDLKGKKFGFGSRKSTLSFYMPCKMLLDAGIFDALESYEYLGKHDKVARNVAMGGLAAGGIKESVAKKYTDSLKVVAKSAPVYDFLFVNHSSMAPEQQDKIRQALLSVEDPAILSAIKSGVTGIIPTSDKNYDDLRTTMKEVDAKVPFK